MEEKDARKLAGPVERELVPTGQQVFVLLVYGKPGTPAAQQVSGVRVYASEKVARAEEDKLNRSGQNIAVLYERWVLDEPRPAGGPQ